MKIECSWKISPTIYKDDLPFGEEPKSLAEECKIIEKAYKALEGSKFKPEVIFVDDFGIGMGMIDYLQSHGVPCRPTPRHLERQ